MVGGSETEREEERGVMAEREGGREVGRARSREYTPLENNVRYSYIISGQHATTAPVQINRPSTSKSYLVTRPTYLAQT